MKIRPLALMLCLAVMPASAEVYKCQQSGGVTVYQQTPCAQDAAGARMDIKVPSAQPVKRSDGERLALKEAYESRMARHDYEGAVAFAANDKERHRALKLAEDKRLKCGSLAIRAQQAQANVKPKNPRSENAAIAAQHEYNLRCR